MSDQQVEQMDYYGGVSGLHMKKNTNFGNRSLITTKQSERKHTTQTGIKTVNVKNLYAHPNDQNLGSYISFVSDDNLDLVQNSIMALIKWMWDVSIEQTPDLDDRLHNLMSSIQQKCKSDGEFADIVDQLYNFQQVEPKNQSGTLCVYHSCLDHQFFKGKGLDDDYVEIFKKYLNIYGDSQNYLKLYALSQTITEQTLTIKGTTATQAFYQNEYIIYTDPNLEAGYCSVVCDKCGAKIVNTVTAFVEYLEKVYEGEDIGEQLSSSHYINCGNQLFTKIGIGIKNAQSSIGAYEFIGLGDPTELAKLQWEVLPDFSILGEVFNDQSSQYLSGYSRRKLIGGVRADPGNAIQDRYMELFHTTIDDDNINFNRYNDRRLIRKLQDLLQFTWNLLVQYQNFDEITDIIRPGGVINIMIQRINQAINGRGDVQIQQLGNDIKRNLEKIENMIAYYMFIRVSHLVDLGKQISCLTGNRLRGVNRMERIVNDFNRFNETIRDWNTQIRNLITDQLKRRVLERKCLYQQQHQIQLVDGDQQDVVGVTGNIITEYENVNHAQGAMEESILLQENFPDSLYFKKQYIKYMMSYSIMGQHLALDDGYNGYRDGYINGHLDDIYNTIIDNTIGKINDHQLLFNREYGIHANIDYDGLGQDIFRVRLIQHNRQQQIFKIFSITPTQMDPLDPRYERISQMRNLIDDFALFKTIYFYCNVVNVNVPQQIGHQQINLNIPQQIGNQQVNLNVPARVSTVFVHHGAFLIGENAQGDLLRRYRYFLRSNEFIKLMYYQQHLYNCFVNTWGMYTPRAPDTYIYMQTGAIYSLIVNIWLHDPNNANVQNVAEIQGINGYIRRILHNDQVAQDHYINTCSRLLNVLVILYDQIRPIGLSRKTVKQILSVIVLYSICENDIMFRYMLNENNQNDPQNRWLDLYKDNYKHILSGKFAQLTMPLKHANIQNEQFLDDLKQIIRDYVVGNVGQNVLIHNPAIQALITHFGQIFSQQ